MESRLNLRGPSRKAKYYLTTDSKLSRATERWEEPRLGEVLNMKPCAYKLSEGYAPQGECLTACLLHNDPATYGYQQVKRLCRGARAKASLNRALVGGRRRETT